MKNLSGILIFAIAGCCLSGCSYYNILRTSNPQQQDFQWAMDQDKFFFVHQRNTVYYIDSLSVVHDTLIGHLGYIWDYYGFLKKDSGGGRFKSTQGHILKEFHLYLKNCPDSLFSENRPVKIPLANIETMNWYNENLTPTILIATLVPVAVIVAILVSFAMNPIPPIM